MNRPLLEEIDTPAAVVDLDVMERNLGRMAELCRDRGVALRPHTKTHKIPELARRQVELGAVGITVAKLGEAEVMAAHGLRRILVAYEMIGQHKMRRLASLLDSARDLELIAAIDSVEGAAQLSDAGVQVGRAIPVLIEVDTGLGRTGVGAVEEVVSLARHVRLFPGLAIEGVMTHEGHVGRDGPTGMEEKSAQAAKTLAECAAALRSLGLDCRTVSAGSTPAARWMAGAPGITELRPGTYIFNDRTQVLVGAAAESDCALTVLSTVVSSHGGKRAMIDAGTKALTSDNVARFGSYGAIAGDPGAVLGACSEEHGHLDTTAAGRPYRVGERVHVLPNHVCPVFNLFDRIYGYRGGKVEVEWRVAARGCVR